MATTRLIPMHTIKNQSVAYTVHERIDYAINPNKSLGGGLVTAYSCDPATAANEMMLTKREYAAFTGKDISKSDVALYQIRQSLYAALLAEKKNLYLEFSEIRQEMRDLQMARANVPD